MGFIIYDEETGCVYLSHIVYGTLKLGHKSEDLWLDDLSFKVIDHPYKMAIYKNKEIVETLNIVEV